MDRVAGGSDEHVGIAMGDNLDNAIGSKHALANGRGVSGSTPEPVGFVRRLLQLEPLFVCATPNPNAHPHPNPVPSTEFEAEALFSHCKMLVNTSDPHRVYEDPHADADESARIPSCMDMDMLVCEGMLDRILLLVARVECETSRDSAWTDAFDHPQAVQQRQRTLTIRGHDTHSSTLPVRLTSGDSIPLWTPSYGCEYDDMAESFSDEDMYDYEMEHDFDETFALMGKRRRAGKHRRHAAMQERLQRDHKTSKLLNFASELLNNVGPNASGRAIRAVEASCLSSVCLTYFFNVTPEHILDHSTVYSSLLFFLHRLVNLEGGAILFQTLPGQYMSLYDLVKSVRNTIENLVVLESIDAGAIGEIGVVGQRIEEHQSFLAPPQLAADKNEEESAVVAGETQPDQCLPELGKTASNWNDIKCTQDQCAQDQVIESSGVAQHLASIVNILWKQLCASREEINMTEGEGKESSGPACSMSTQNTEGEGESYFSGDLWSVYENLTENVKVLSFPILSSGAGSAVAHFYHSSINADVDRAPRRLRKIMRELSGLSSFLPLHFQSSVLLRYDEDKPFVLQALIAAPDTTPYDSGLFLFDIYCPPHYPDTPPKVNLMTTGGGTVRFSPNLYECGKVCLSLLGTWGGSEDMKWSQDSNIAQVLISIQSAILGATYPFFLEPGCEMDWMTERGMNFARTSSNGGYESLRIATIQHAMVGMMISPPEQFQDFVVIHFWVKKWHILNSVTLWIQEAITSDTVGHLQSLTRQAIALYHAFLHLSSNPEVREGIVPGETRTSALASLFLWQIKVNRVQEIYATTPTPGLRSRNKNNNTHVFDCFHHILSKLPRVQSLVAKLDAQTISRAFATGSDVPADSIGKLHLIRLFCDCTRVGAQDSVRNTLCLCGIGDDALEKSMDLMIAYIREGRDKIHREHMSQLQDHAKQWEEVAEEISGINHEADDLISFVHTLGLLTDEGGDRLPSTESSELWLTARQFEKVAEKIKAVGTKLEKLLEKQSADRRQFIPSRFAEARERLSLAHVAAQITLDEWNALKERLGLLEQWIDVLKALDVKPECCEYKIEEEEEFAIESAVEDAREECNYHEREEASNCADADPEEGTEAVEEKEEVEGQDNLKSFQEQVEVEPACVNSEEHEEVFRGQSSGEELQSCTML